MQTVIVAFENRTTAANISEVLESGGVADCVVCHSAAEVRRLVNKQGLGVVVCGFKFPDGSGEDLYYDLPDSCVMMMVAPQNRLELCETEEIFQLPAPVSRGDLLASVRMLLQFARRRVSRYPVHIHRSEEENQLVAQAKAVLMDRHGMTEEQAHRFLQKESMDHGAKLAETARIVLGNSI